MKIDFAPPLHSKLIRYIIILFYYGHYWDSQPDRHHNINIVHVWDEFWQKRLTAIWTVAGSMNSERDDLVAEYKWQQINR